MGLLLNIVGFPLLGPVHLLRTIAERVGDVVQQETSDTARMRAELVELQIRYELGELTEDEYVAQEEALLSRIDDVRRRQEGDST